MTESPVAPQLVTLRPLLVASLRETIPTTGITDFFDRAFAPVMRVLEAQGVHPIGPPVGIYYSMPTDTVDLAVGFPVDRAITPAEGVVAATLPAGRAAQLTHAGAYDSMADSYARLMDWAQQEGLQLAPMMWESYLTEPTPDADPSAMRTLITWPVQDASQG